MKVKQLKKQLDNVKEQCNAGSTLVHSHEAIVHDPIIPSIDTSSAPVGMIAHNVIAHEVVAAPMHHYGGVDSVSVSISNDHHEHNYVVSQPQVQPHVHVPVVDYAVVTKAPLKLGSSF